jgi:origin recognition complex subunit 5
MDDFDFFDDALTRNASERFPGYEAFMIHLGTLLSTTPPSFIYVQDPYSTIRLTASALKEVLLTLYDPQLSYNQRNNADGVIRLITVAQVDAAACFTPRLLYDRVLNELANWTPEWENGCVNWTDGGKLRYNDSLDGFVHGLQALEEMLVNKDMEHEVREAKPRGKSRNKGKGKEKVLDSKREVRMVLVVERAERFAGDALADLLIPFTRLAEIVRWYTMNSLVKRLELLIDSLESILQPYFYPRLLGRTLSLQKALQ